MTRVVAVTKLEECLDSSVVEEFQVMPPVSDSLMRALAAGGRLQHFPHFPRPYFRIDRPRHYVIQGIVGAERFRVTFSPSAGPGTEELLRSLIDGSAEADHA
jgi:hypothetical protein